MVGGDSTIDWGVTNVCRRDPDGWAAAHHYSDVSQAMLDLLASQ